MRFIDNSVNLVERKTAVINAFLTTERVTMDVFDYVCDEIKAIRHDRQALSQCYVRSVHNPNVFVRLYSEDINDRCIDTKRCIPIKPYKWVSAFFFISVNDNDEIPFARFMVESALGFKIDKNLTVTDPDIQADLTLIRILNYKNTRTKKK